MTINLALKIAAYVCFILAAFGLASLGGTVALLPLGLAFFVASFMP